MKNSQKGFIVPVLLIIIALLVVGGGVYVYESKKTETPIVVDTETQQSNQVQQQTNTQTSNTQQNSQNNEGAITYASANLSATPTTGVSPLTVNFEGQIKVPYNQRGRAIMFFGDGVSDVMFRSGPDLFSEKWTHTFNKSGEYDAIMVLTSVQDVDSDIQVMNNPYYSKNLVIKKVHISVKSSPTTQTYTNAQYAFSVNYPQDWKTPTTYFDPYLKWSISNFGSEGFSIDALSPEKGYTLEKFTTGAWFHGPNDPYTNTVIGGRSAVRYDLIFPQYGRGESSQPLGYTRTIQYGVITPNGSILTIYYEKSFKTQAEAQAADLSKADQYITWIKF
ncbi:MAG: hypothetical protein G01um101466_311 [Parcubacteria group bacterium Gr01-1014_66]|nr:MAG: hypothetical protein G01um101466_311 [Parcubacteria group bacterium Gr01-1014_66]